MDLRSTIERRLKTDPTITICVKRLSLGERFERNAKIEQWPEYRDKVAAMGASDDEREKRRISMDVEEIEHRYIRPVVIREGLHAVAGLTVDGREPDSLKEKVEAILAYAKPEVLDEIFTICWHGSELTADQEKNLLLPGISSTQGMPGSPNTTVASADGNNSTPGETVAVISPTT